MPRDNFLAFHSQVWLVAAIALVVLTATVAIARRPALPRMTLGLCGLGALLLALAAGGPQWSRAIVEPVAVMVDLSPSTRTAEFRDREALDRRIRDLLRDVPYRILYFAQSTTDISPPGRRLADLAADHTVFSPPAAPAVLLFSDCQFETPQQAPPTYIALDGGLEDVDDAAISKLEIRGDQAAVTIRNSGSARQFTVRGTSGTVPSTLPAGSMVLTWPLLPGAKRASAELAPGDAWPENDALSLELPPAQQFERWWVSRSNAPVGWRGMSPDQLPVDPTDYLSCAIIALENLPASGLTESQQQRLAQYVRDMGGAVLILGGNRAFAAGGYEGSTLDAICPLAADPPAPTTHWILLADSSGSMSSAESGTTRFGLVAQAIAQLLPHLPLHDLLSAGSFAESLNWWTQGKPVAEAQSQELPPAGVLPHGPTNLQQALDTIADSNDPQIPAQLLVLSDFDAQLSDAPALQAKLRAKHIRLHLLAIGQGSALEVMRRMAASTGGAAMTQLDPKQWAQSVRELAQAASQDRVQRDPIDVAFRGDATAAPAQTISTWNRVWLKSGAERLADASLQSQTIPMAARWHDGEGEVVAAAFDPGPRQLEVLQKLVARPPNDPRFHVTCKADRHLTVTVDAIDSEKPLNDESISLELKELSAPGSRAVSEVIPQTGPGRYELDLPAPRTPELATVRDRGKVIAQAAVAGRYAPEFDALGNEREAMSELARRTGGQVITPDQTSPISIRWPRRAVPLTSLLAIAGAALIALGLAWWRIR